MTTATSTNSPMPATGSSTVELDVRDDLRNGREPFSRIMATVGALRPDDTLHLRATFEPAPLFKVMGKRGYAYRAEQHAPDDWSVWFFRAAQDGERESENVSEPRADSADSAHTAHAHVDSGDDVVLDVRGLEPPEPMVRTLEALEQLPEGRTLLQVNVRVPQILLPILHERGYAYEVHDPGSGEVRVRIWRASPDVASSGSRP